MADAATTESTDDLAADLEAAAADLERAERAVEREGEAELRALAETHERFLTFIDDYDGRATGSGQEAFRNYLSFQDELVRRVERLPDDLLHREAFERVGDLLDKRRLSRDDMARARETLAPAAETAAKLSARRDARKRYRRARSAVERRRREVDAAIDERGALLAFADVDLEADLAPLREPVEAYNAAVRSAFAAYSREAPAVDVLDLLDAAAAYPLVDLEPAPPALAGYLRAEAVGAEPITRLVELADYSPSKLAHFVDDPGRFRAVVAANRTYLDRLDATALEVAWPPPPAPTFRFLARELVAVVDRFADEAPVARLHELRSLTRDPAYERLRESAVARDRLDADERERLRSGSVSAEVDALRDERDRLDALLEAHPA